MNGLAATAARALPGVATGVFLLLLGNMYLLRLRPLADLVTAAVVVVAVLALVARAEPARFRHAMLGWLGAAAALLLAGAALSPEVVLAEAGLGIRALALIAAFLLFARALFRAQGATRVLTVLFVAGALGAAFSVALHLATAPGLSARIEMLGRPANPIPAAGGIAAAALAGITLLRAGLVQARWRVLAWVALGVMGLAMLFSQSRGPVLGFGLGAALLLLPPARTLRPGAWAGPAAFLLASSIVLVEAPLRAVFCTGDAFVCRPSLRLPLWEHAAGLIGGHPAWGLGFQHQIGGGLLNNPQNVALTVGVYFGLPGLLLAAAGVAMLLRRLAAGTPGVGPRWAAALMGFAGVYYAFEPNPFAFYNAHWLFFWLPVAAILSAER